VSIFSKAVSQVETADLQELVQEKAVENARLEFKLLVPSKDDTSKKLSSFANTFGGYMVVGAKANSADGRIEDLPGVDEEAGYKQKVIDWCFKHVSPPLTVEVSDPIPAPNASGKVCYVIYTPESEVAPHFLNGRKGIWVRTDEFSARFEAELANDNELRHLLDRRKLIRERRVSLLDRARKRFDTLAAADRGEHIQPGPYAKLRHAYLQRMEPADLMNLDLEIGEGERHYTLMSLAGLLHDGERAFSNISISCRFSIASILLPPLPAAGA
jgi:predicted HTH transcriptional regulator